MENGKDHLLALLANQKTRRIIIGAASALLLLIVIIFLNMGGVVIIDKDTIINNNFTLAGNKEVVLKNGAKLTIIGDMIIKGTLSCDGGTLPLVVRDSLTVTGKIRCSLPDNAPTGAGIAIAITAKHMLFDKSAELTTNGHIELVSDAAKFLSSADTIAHTYRETVEDTGSSPRIGPLTEDNNAQAMTTEQTSASIKTAEAGGPTDNATGMIIGGTWFIGDIKILPSGLSIPTPPKSVKDILVLLDTGEEGAITLQDLHLIGPSGKDGDDDIAKNCSARGKSGENAFRMRVSAGNIDLNNVQIELGGGGGGGNAETLKDCANATAQGGAGGEAGNFKMTAAKGIHILNFMITPGKGGDGGNATAFARNGGDSCPGGDGGDAAATGGAGERNKKELATAGNVTGLDNIKTGRVVGGSGGNALATPGKGGKGTECGCKGGKGGDGNATGGNGGDAWAAVPVGTIEGHGGDGGSADTRGAPGGNGGSCPLKQSGGDGGAGGDAKASAGLPGKGLTANGNTGVIKNQGGGDGGAGGDGCNPGIGGQGGIGAPIGALGSLGKNMCVDNTEQSPPQQTGPTLVRAILYKGKYLPVDQLIIENEAGCGAEHWHAAQGTVKATDDTVISDPGPQCGFGKVKDNQPEMVPKNTTHGTLIQLQDDNRF